MHTRSPARRRWLLGSLVWGGLLLLTGPAVAQSRLVEFNRDIRPIFSENCYACHGPDQNTRKAELRLDTEQGAKSDRDGHPVIVPGNAARSELFRRIASEDVKHRMPPARVGKRLSAEQIETIRRWIDQGAPWQKHWSLLPAKRPPLPTVTGSTRPINAIDHFILDKVAQVGLKPAPEADRRTLLRRLSFDLLGLPPTPEQVDAFLDDTRSDAVERVVERLLRSPHFGERMALHWLDLVRYADTGGYHSDNHRDLALYRDWVINAFNRNLPFDLFTVEQLAGDLLPNATREQRIASGYNRLLQTTEEGGAQAREYTAKYAADRVRNVSSVWLGQTLGCAECHDHKFDPFTTAEFYSFAAFFADIREKPVGRQDQTLLPLPDQEYLLRGFDEEIAPLQKLVNASTPELEAAQLQWEEALLQKPAEERAKLVPKDLLTVLDLEPEKRSQAQAQALATHYRTNVSPELKAERVKLVELLKRKQDFEKKLPSTLVSAAVAPRTMRVLPRGNWLDDSGLVVQPSTPAALNPLLVKDRRATRVDLARWLLTPDNPLTARVFVNRLCALFFGQGLVSTPEDFGAQGAWPTHPELLDWLAIEFRASGWDVRHLIKLLVTSRTYRQASAVPEAVRLRDPYNRGLARQGRYRLDAEMVRDNALAVSGLLIRKVGGASVKPYQPAGYWAYLNFPRREWQKDTGDDQYRRGLYTYWCRTFLHPSLVAFDAPSREECTVERPRSNTPQQALVLLNDPTYVEAARVFAERMLREGGDTDETRISFAYRHILGRKPTREEVGLLSDVLVKHLEQYRGDKQAATALLSVGDRLVPSDLDAVELAAWTSVVRVVLNLHETITRN